MKLLNQISTRYIGRIAVALLLLSICHFLYGQTVTGSEDIFGNVLEIISAGNKVDADTVGIKNSEPFESLKEIVSEYYAEEVIDDDVPVDVLAYLSEIYSKHDFYETGYWGPKEKKRNLPVYKGSVPESDPSDFYMPVWGGITSGYGFRKSRGRMHHGLDLSLHVGDTVRAALPGVVTYVSYEEGGYGNYVVLAHSNGLETRYAHLSLSLVKPGQTVKSGEAIALGGTTGNSTGPHLHFETRQMGIPVDPFTIFDFRNRNF